MAVHLGLHLPAEVIQILPQAFRDIFQRKGQVDVHPVAVGFVKRQLHALGVRRGRGSVGLLHLGIGAHIAAHRHLVLAVVQAEGLPQQGDALRKGRVHRVQAAEQHKGRRRGGQGPAQPAPGFPHRRGRGFLPGRQLLAGLPQGVVDFHRHRLLGKVRPDGLLLPLIFHGKVPPFPCRWPGSACGPGAAAGAHSFR